jgi:hypothetical protein
MRVLEVILLDLGVFILAALVSALASIGLARTGAEGSQSSLAQSSAIAASVFHKVNKLRRSKAAFQKPYQNRGLTVLDRRGASAGQ